MLKNWLKKNEGTTAIEFSLLAVPFFLTCISLLELALFFASGALMQSAVQDAARTIKTGQLQQSGSGDPQQEFLDALCERAGSLLDCNNFQYHVQKLDSFDDNLDPPVDEDGNLQPPEVFQLNQITAGCVGLVRIIYPYQFMTPLFGSLWSNYPGNTRILMSTVVFQTEPYNFEVSDPTCSV